MLLSAKRGQAKPDCPAEVRATAANRGCEVMEKNVVKHVLADMFWVTGEARGERETRNLFELLLRSYRSRQMDWHEECLLAAWDQYEQWQHSLKGHRSSRTSKRRVWSRKKKEPQPYPIRLEKRGRNEWEFAWPGELLGLMDKLRTGCNYLQEGDLNRARRLFSSIVRKCPYFIDALNYLGLIEWHMGNPVSAENYYLRAYETGQSVLPPEFRGRLPWGWIDNRPFLQALHGLALVKLRRGYTDEAGRLFEQLISLDPDDHLEAGPILDDIKKGVLYRDE